jgi:hypothetical protein
MNSKMKTLLLLSGLIFISSSLMAQSSLTIDASQAYTNFLFTDSEGNKENAAYSGNYSGSYSVGYQYAQGVLFRANIGMRKAGATTVIDETNYMWDLQYADVKLGIGYMFSGERIRPYFIASPYFAYLLKANQRINNEDFDIKKLEAIGNSDYGFFASPGIQLTLSDFISAYTQFNYMRGLQNLENDGGSTEGSNTASSGQKAYNTAYSVSLGLSFTIK